MKTEDSTTQTLSNDDFAPATQPIAATTIITDSTDILSGDTAISTQGESMPAFYARPRHTPGPLPIILVVQEFFGVHAHIRDICRRLAHEGYLAIAPELYFRQGDASAYDDIPTLLREVVSKVPDNQVLADLDHVANWAARHEGDMRNMAITGFCWGGRITWLYAAHNPQLKAAVAWYGRLTGDKTMKQPKQPVDIAVNLNAPVLGLYGANDESIPLDTIDTMRQALHAAHAHADIIVYPDAGHAFNADYRPSYHADAASDGWQRMLAWFRQFGVMPKEG